MKKKLYRTGIALLIILAIVFVPYYFKIWTDSNQDVSKLVNWVSGASGLFLIVAFCWLLVSNVKTAWQCIKSDFQE
jgi:hypothetical protein